MMIKILTMIIDTYIININMVCSIKVSILFNEILYSLPKKYNRAFAIINTIIMDINNNILGFCNVIKVMKDEAA